MWQSCTRILWIGLLQDVQHGFQIHRNQRFGYVNFNETKVLKGFCHRKIIFEIELQKDLLIFSYLFFSYIRLKIRFQSKDIQSFLIKFGRFFVLSGCEYHIWYSHPITMPNTIENESKNPVQINKMAINEKHKTWKQSLKCKYLLIEKEFQYAVYEFSAQLFEMNNILKIFFYGRIPLTILMISDLMILFRTYCWKDLKSFYETGSSKKWRDQCRECQNRQKRSITAIFSNKSIKI